MASKKGVALTVGIVAAIVGASFLIWLIPQSNIAQIGGAPNEEILSSVYSRHNTLAFEIDTKFAAWQTGNVPTEEMAADVSKARSETEEMRQTLVQASPSEEWNQSFELYIKALESFALYLEAMEGKVQQDDRSPDEEMSRLKQESQNYVEESVNAIPLGG